MKKNHKAAAGILAAQLMLQGAVLMPQTALIPQVAHAAEDGITVTGGTTVPTTLKKGSLVNVKGIVTSASSNIVSVTVGVYNASGKMVTGKTQSVGAKTYDLSKLDYAVSFNTLPVGSYTYGVFVTNGTSKNYLAVKQIFTVSESGTSTVTPTPSTTDDSLTVSGGTTVPATLKKGALVNVKGTITSAVSNITSLTVGVYDASGKLVTGRTVQPSAKTYDLAKLDNYVSFDTLAEGTYAYKVVATNAAHSNQAVVTQNFTVGTAASTTPTTPTATAASDSLYVSGGTQVPATLKTGGLVTVRGTLTSGNSNITSVTVGVYDKSTGKMVTGKTVAPNTKTYNLYQLDNDLTFDKLPAGNYVYRVTASNGTYSGRIVVGQSFTVSASGTSTTPAVSTTDTLTVTGGTTMPAALKVGSYYNVKGTLTSASTNLTSVTVGVYDASGKMVTGKTQAVNAKSYSLANLDYAVAFNKLPVGTYTYGVYASNGTNKNQLVVKQVFAVTTDGKPAASTPTQTTTATDSLYVTSGTSIPTTLKKGAAVIVRGTLRSGNSNISSVSVGVYDKASGKLVTGRTASPNAKTYNLNLLDSAVTFDKLPVGNYVYRVIASNGAYTNRIVAAQSFAVTADGKPASSTTPSTPASTTDSLYMTGAANIPATLKKGQSQTIQGKINSGISNISTVSVGVYNKANGQLMTGKTTTVNAKTFDVHTLDGNVDFTSLAQGEYVYRVIASNSAYTGRIVFAKSFSVYESVDPVPAATTDSLYLAGGTQIPASLKTGSSVAIKGTIKSGSTNITSVSVGVYNKANNQLVSGKTVSTAAKTYDLAALDKEVDFDKLAEGNYVYRVIASNGAYTGRIVYAQSFTVAKDGSSTAQTTSSDGITVTGGTTVPTNLKKGSLVNVKGTVTSASSNITSVTVGVYNSSGKMVTGKTQAVNAKTYDLSKLDYAVTFNTLGLGTYTYGVYVSNGTTKNVLAVKQVFNVTADGKAPAGTSTTTPAASSDTMTVSGGTTVPATLRKGAAVIVKGTVNSASSNLTSVTAGVYDASGKMVTGRTASPGAKSYDLNKLDAGITFNTLAAGTYTYRVYATNGSSSNTLLISQNFTVQ